MKRYNTPHRSRVVKTRMTEEEYAEFAERLSAYNMSQAEFIRQAITGAAIRPIITVSPVNDELLAAVGNTELKPNVASKYLTRFYSEVFAPMGITYEYRKTAAARMIMLALNDGADGNAGLSGTERLASLRAKNDGISSLPDSPSQSSFASWEEVDDDEGLPF